MSVAAETKNTGDMMITRYIPAINGTIFIGMIAHEGTSESHYVRSVDYDKLDAEVTALKHDIERHLSIATGQQIEIEHLRNLLRGVGFGETDV